MTRDALGFDENRRRLPVERVDALTREQMTHPVRYGEREAALREEGFFVAVQAIERWAGGFYSVRTKRYLEAVVSDLRKQHTGLLAALGRGGEVMARDDTFTCALCKGTFEKGRSDAEAAAELGQNFPGFAAHECDLVCDTCYNTLQPQEED